MNLEDVNKSEYFDSAIMPYGMKLTHLPTGLSVRGNCKHEQSKLNMERTLMDTLGIFVTQAESQDASLKRKSKAEQENEALRSQLEQMQIQLDNLAGALAGKVNGTPVKSEPKPKAAKPKNKGGWTPERRAQQAATIAARKQAAEPKMIDTPTGPMTEEQLMRQTLRPPTEAPQRLPKAHTSHGATVAKSDVDWIKP